MTSTTHRAARLHGTKDLRLEDVPTPAPLPHQVQIRPRATGICGTDMHYYSAGRNGIFTVTTPLVLGHEAAGEVVAVGSDVKNIKVGDRVAVEPQRPCSTCPQCKAGTYNVCPSMKFSGSASASPPVQGSLQELYCHEAAFVHSLPEKLSWIEGAMVEPLSVAVHAVKRSGLRVGQRVLILGAGPVGLLCAAVAKVSGASSIAMIDIDSARLEFARANGLANAIHTIPMRENEGEDKDAFPARLAKEALVADGFGLCEVVFDCTGVATCVNIGIRCAAPCGKVVLVGMGAAKQSIEVGVAAVREVDLVAVWRYANTFSTAIALLTSGQVDVKAFVTHTYDLTEAAKALETVVARPADLVKCVITAN
ncbi:Sorbitol dehydrogenase-like protein [Elsinoe fawcettii]|nr:Sorbitol dehydrogenase-like protein [Elsinoe fawcettii]